jgi:hypothetical protein
MTDPNRIADESPTATEARLLHSASLDVAPPHGKLGVLAALGLGSTGVTAAAAATTAVTISARAATPIATVAKWVAFGAVAGAVATGAGETARSYVTDSQPRHETPVRAYAAARTTKRAGGLPETNAPSSKSSDERALSPAPIGEAHDERSAENVEVGEAQARRGLKAPAAGQLVRTPGAGAAETPEEPPLSAELKSMDAVRRSLTAHDPATALDLLAEHERDFPAPRLAPEATVLRVEALLALGKKSEAIRTGESFLASDAASAYRDHVQSLLREARRTQ